MSGGAMSGGAMSGGAMSGGAMSGGAMSGGAMSGGAMSGGNCGCANIVPLLKGGKCPLLKGGFTGPNGLVGTAWKPDASTWPAVSPTTNHLSYNTYDNDISRQMKTTGIASPFTVGGKKRMKRMLTKKYRGGSAGQNSLVQDFFSLGNQFMFNGQSAFNAIRGAPQPVNPSPTSQPQLINLNNLK